MDLALAPFIKDALVLAGLSVVRGKAGGVQSDQTQKRKFGGTRTQDLLEGLSLYSYSIYSRSFVSSMKSLSDVTCF